MARFQWFDGNQGFYAYDRFDTYLESGRTATGLTLAFDVSAGLLNPTIAAGNIELVYSGYASHIVEEGPSAGTEIVTGGKLTGIRYLAHDGALLMQVTHLNLSLAMFINALERGDAFSAWRMVTQSDNTLSGANAAQGMQTQSTGDVIDTGGHRDIVTALGGNDYILDRGGADTYAGGSGFDTVSYDGWFFAPANVRSGIVADLVLGTVFGPDETRDSLTSIEAVNGTFLADVIKGNAVANNFVGFGGADLFDGRGGFDMVSYSRDASQGGYDGIRANLVSGRIRDGFGSLDTVISIEGVEGSEQRDVFIDNAADNYFSGRAGFDLFQLGLGNDTVNGGGGADIFQFRGTSFGDDTIQDFDRLEGDKIAIDGVSAFNQLHISTVIVGGDAAAFVQCASGSLTIPGLVATDLLAADFGF